MTQFFELSDDVLLAIYKKLPPHELLSLVSAGEKLPKFRRLSLDALFMQQMKIQTMFPPGLVVFRQKTTNI